MIDYVITITSTGNVTLTNLIVKDILTDGAGNALDLRTSPGTGTEPMDDSFSSSRSNLTFINVSYASGEAVRSQALATQLESQLRSRWYRGYS